MAELISLVEKIREKKPEYSHMDDSTIVQMVRMKKPQLLERYGSDEVSRFVNEARQKKTKMDRQKQFKSMSGGGRFTAGMGAGMMDVFMGIKQAFGGDTSNFKEDKEAYLEASEGDIASGIGEFTGQMVATAPVPGLTGTKVASKVANPLLKGAIKTGTAMGVGAGMGATEHVDEGETRLKNTLYGSLFGAGGLLASKGLGKAFNSLKGKYKNASAQELMDLAKKYDVEPSLGDITDSQLLKKAETLSENVPGAGMSGFREKGAKKYQTAAEGLVEKAKKEMVGTGEEMGDDWTRIMQESANKKAKSVRSKATKLYNKVDELSSGNTVKPSNAQKKAKEFSQEISEDAFEGDANPMEKVAEKLDKEMSFKQLRKQRSKAGKKMTEAYKSGKDELGRMYKEIRTGIEEDIEGLVTRHAEVGSIPKKNMIGKGKIDDRKPIKLQNKNDELKKAFHEAQDYYKKEVVPFKDKALAKAMKTDEPDQIYKKFIQKDAGDRANKFYKALDDKGRSAVRYGMLNDAYTKSIESGSFSPKKFESRLKKLESPKNVFFRGEKKKEVDGFKNLMEHGERFGQYAENPPTGQRLAQILGAASYINPAVPASALAVRLLSSKAGKRLVLSASEVEPGSDKMAKLLKSFQDNLPKASAVAGEELSED